MCKVLLVGNPNVGKSTLFNSLTKSNEHTGNFHGVTVNEKSKTIKLNNATFNVVDLPGIYSLNTFSDEEDVTKSYILNSKKDTLLVVADCNSLKKNLYLCMQLNELGINYKLLLNNYKSYLKSGNKINLNKLKQNLGVDVEIINAKNIKPTLSLLKNNKKNTNDCNYLNSYLTTLKSRTNLSANELILAINGVVNNLTKQQIDEVKKFMPSIIEERYKHINNLIEDCVSLQKNFIYGYSKLDNFILNPTLPYK